MQTDKGAIAREKLAKAFEAEGDPDMADRARAGYYGDFTSPLAAPIMQLVMDCREKGYTDIAKRAMNGDFDG